MQGMTRVYTRVTVVQLEYCLTPYLLLAQPIAAEGVFSIEHTASRARVE